MLKKNILKSEKQLISQLSKVYPDIIVACHFNFILSKKILSIPRLGSINLHPSLLPLYRGLSPALANIEF